ALLLVAALGAMTSMHEVHASVLSEPLFLACLALVLAALARRPDDPWRAGIPAAVAMLTRYAGAALVGATVLWMLVRPGRLRDRLRRATFAALPAMVLQGAWVVRTQRLAGTRAIRKIALYGDLGPTFRQGVNTLVAWLVPDALANDADAIRWRGALAVGAGVALAAMTIHGLWEARVASRGYETPESDTPARARVAMRTATAAALLVVCYLAIVLVSRLLADPMIPLDERLLAPAILLVTVVIAIGTDWWLRARRTVPTRAVVVAALLVWWLGAFSATRLEARWALSHGSDFAGEEWRRSELLAWARDSAASRPLYTNWPAAIFFHWHRASHVLPKRGASSRELRAFGDTVRARGAVVLQFATESAEYVTTKDLLRTGLHLIAELDDGTVWGRRRR
ncbi:MAG: hypothetical protein H0W68_11575, partial [Gemmatimonadaceae bacterium]|nr:hypothetical protein [Gemmatimonadaceae bacterium]